MVFITVQNLVGIDAVVNFGNMHVFRLGEFGLNTPIHAPKMFCFEILTPKWGAI